MVEYPDSIVGQEYNPIMTLPIQVMKVPDSDPPINGCVATKHIHRGERLCEFVGAPYYFFNDDEANQDIMYNSRYGLKTSYQDETGKFLYLDASVFMRFGPERLVYNGYYICGGFVNSVHVESKANCIYGYQYESEENTKPTSVFLQAIKDIAFGDELLCFYGYPRRVDNWGPDQNKLL